MSTPIVISPSQQRGNKCALGDVEQDHCHKIGQLLLARFIADDRFNPYLVPKLTGGTDTDRLISAANMSNDHIRANGGKGYTIALHTDGGYAGSGCSAFYYTEGIPSQWVAEAIHAAISELTSWSDMRSVARPELYELNHAIDQAVLVEMSFHDQMEEAEWIHSNMQMLADTIYTSVCNSLGLEPIVPEIPEPDPQPVDPEAWKHTPIDKLAEDGIITDPAGWHKKIDEPMPVWAAMLIVQRIYEKLKK